MNIDNFESEWKIAPDGFSSGVDFKVWLANRLSALEARLKEAETAFRSIESFPLYAYGDNEAACSMVAIASAWLKEAQA